MTTHSRGITRPSFREQIAIVYDEYLDTLGGGERSALAYALALQKLDFQVEIVSGRPLPNQHVIAEIFGEEFSAIPMRQVSTDNLFQYLADCEPTVFVNHTFQSFTRNPAKIGIYSQMFPVVPIRKESHPKETQALSTYNCMLCNSSFTRTYTIGMWDFPADKSEVLIPPIGSRHVETALRVGSNMPQKIKQFVNVGRFNPGTHNKNQKIIIATN